MYRQHERGAQIPRVLTILLVLGLCFLLFAKNTKRATPSVSSNTEYEAKIEEKNNALDSIKQELEKGRAKLHELQNQEGTVLSQIEQLEKNIKTSENYLRSVSVKIDSASRSITNLTQKLGETNQELDSRVAVMKKRLRAMYKAGSQQLPEVILSSQSMLDAMYRVRYYQELTKYDHSLVVKIDSARTRIQENKTKLEREQRRLASFKHDKESEYSQLVDEQGSHQKLLTDVRGKKETFVKMIRELEAAQKELQNIVAMLEKNKRKKVRTQYEKSLNASFEKKKGNLPWPVKGKVVTDFGRVIHSVYKTVTMNTGIDISCHNGDKVECIAAGKVVYTGYMRGLGKLVIVDHSGYYSTYARLNETFVDNDAKVEAGSVIGTVGELNPFDGPRLHFEIRRSTEAIDPMDWLEGK